MGGDCVRNGRGAASGVSLMVCITFLKAVASERASFRTGAVVRVPRLPAGWDRWLQAGVIRVESEDATETAVAPAGAFEAPTAHGARGRGRKRHGAAAVA